MNILIIAAHPDDEVLGCGATIARLSALGHTVSIAILGTGVASRCNGLQLNYETERDALRECARQAAGVLGAHEIMFYDLPDNRFDTVAFLDVVKLIEGIVRKIEPDTVYTHSRWDLNVDHRITSCAVITALRPLSGQRVREIYAFEVASSTEWNFGGAAQQFSPDTFMNIEGFLDVKNEALRKYKTEIRDFPHPRSTEYITSQAVLRGAQIGYEKAEAFETIWRRLDI